MENFADWISQKRESLLVELSDQKKIYALVVLAVIVAGGFFLISRQIFANSIPIAQAQTNSNYANYSSANSKGTLASTGNADGSSGAATLSGETTTIYVDVSGKVKHPGLYPFSKGERVNDALKAAGGALSGVDLTYLNLADLLSDGEEIVVSSSPQILSGSVLADASAATSVGGASTSKSSKGSKSTSAKSGKKSLPTRPINLNSATAAQLEELPGVGPAMAQKIIAYRQSLGHFTNITQLQNISGMGPSHFAKIKAYVTTA